MVSAEEGLLAGGAEGPGARREPHRSQKYLFSSQTSESQVPARRRAAWVTLGVAAAAACCFAAASMVTSDAGPVALKSQRQESLSKQLQNTANMVNDFSSVPSMGGSGGGGGGAAASASAPAAPSLGLHGMSQKQFEGVVDKDVTAKVAQVLLETMRPLKRVLREQQEKIDMLEHHHSHEAKAEQRIAGRLSSDLKTGLLSHLKVDVDREVHRTLTPKALLRAERAKKALRTIKRRVKTSSTSSPAPKPSHKSTPAAPTRAKPAVHAA
eukprot:CAMPEP_0173379632 /NCGR_PEP_ID=MMETSP1356-20130122/2497_1 /TAXON_ID=77927 ORGANISM="Hemiselmis virescens, Strain PCC157" /NCGR_SAMPLE_ID=MMETSP1356 /ASSEMBLY_ACC=CAM_ASM_000847 /LENGTH=267 /DNA_ID=CAMNT_0014332993 /DNA_START=59 /DNA_END=858 /DNA_ORIENTATION=+